MRKPATAASALILIALALAGCGDTVDKNAYVKAVTAVQAKTSADANKLSSQMATAKTPAQVADKLDQLGVAVEDNAKNLAAIKVPEEVTAQHAKYVTLMQNFGANLEKLAAKVKKATPSTVGSVLTQATSLTTALSTEESKIVSAINAALQS